MRAFPLLGDAMGSSVLILGSLSGSPGKGDTRPFKVNALGQLVAGLGGTYVASPVAVADGLATVIRTDAWGNLQISNDAGAPNPISIASGDSLSAALDLGNYRVGAVWMPASVGTTTVITFAVSQTSGGTYQQLNDQFGQEYRLNSIVASGVRAVDTEIFRSFRYIKIRRGTASSPNTEAVAHTYFLGLIP